MNRLERIELAIKKGYTCNPETGEVFGIRGGVLANKNADGYAIINLKSDSKRYRIYSHQFIWYVANKEVAEFIDHINRNKSDNRIANLRSVSIQENNFNITGKGYWLESSGKYTASIRLDNKKMHLGTFDTSDEAHKAYLDAKKIYHNING
jgi:hypothetical protein